MIKTGGIGNAGDPGGQLGIESERPEILVDLDENVLAKVFPVALPGYHTEYHLSHQAFMVFDDEGHGIHKLKNKRVAYPAVVEFLNRYL